MHISGQREKIVPIYEYTCPQCRNVFEKWLKLSDTTEKAPCPQCGGPAQRIISHTAFVLKGGGWYVTDYGYRKGTSEEGQAPASDAGTPPASAASGASEQSANPAASGAAEQSASPAPAAPAPSQPA
jgi:putative FmdB family regulatory protein